MTMPAHAAAHAAAAVDSTQSAAPPSAAADQTLQLLGIVAPLERELLRDAAGLHVLGQRHVHRLHAVASTACIDE